MITISSVYLDKGVKSKDLLQVNTSSEFYKELHPSQVQAENGLTLEQWEELYALRPIDLELDGLISEGFYGRIREHMADGGLPGNFKVRKDTEVGSPIGYIFNPDEEVFVDLSEGKKRYAEMYEEGIKENPKYLSLKRRLEQGKDIRFIDKSVHLTLFQNVDMGEIGDYMESDFTPSHHIVVLARMLLSE